jgi:homoserine O-acetyltransferase/O-succinyltransferase
MNEADSVGIVETQYFRFAEPPDELVLESGKRLGPITVAYETYGRLSEGRDNAVLLTHALSGDAHAAGRHHPDDTHPGWWDNMVGPGKAFDTNRYFVICSNFIGGCKGSTGPSSINPSTGRPYGLDFPMITVSDMVKVQKKLIEHLGLESLLTVSGGSLGGMQALEWALAYPASVRSVIPIASTSRLSDQGIAFNEVGRNAITSDPNWNGGDYYGREIPAGGLAIARMIGHITYLSDEGMGMKFGRRLQDKEDYGYDFSTDFAVESYLKYQGDKFVERFDANSYLYITKAMDYFDIKGKYGSLVDAFSRVTSKFLVISFTSDWLFPSYQSKEIVKALMVNDKDVSYCEIRSAYGHDSFLLEGEKQARLMSSFLRSV